MANNYFQFKQFTIHQENCAMKVCTDACLFGAWVADSKAPEVLTNCLDIGTGTGLLSLMLAQKTTADIDAVEIDYAAYAQALENFKQSPWQNRLQVYNIDILNFVPAKEYDCIISNPPFFENDLKSANAEKNAAKHDSSLTLHQLLGFVNRHLSPGGFFSILLPYHRLKNCIETAEENGLYPTKQLLVKQTPAHGYFRAMIVFTREKQELVEVTMLIKNERGNYTEPFTELLKDYYLYL